MHGKHDQQRRGAAAVEFALMLPVLLVLFVASVDFARVFHNAQIITDCARTGALYASNPDLADSSPYASVQDAITAAADGIQPSPTIKIVEGVDARGVDYVEVTVSQPFELVCNFFGANVPTTISRTVRARLHPAAVLEKGG